MKYFFNRLKLILSIFINSKILKKPDFSEKKIFLQGKINEENNQKKKLIKDFTEIEFSVFSQFGEDGIISWLVGNIPNIPKIFIEIGTQDYWESNTRFLLKSKGWKGYIIECNQKDVNNIKKQRIYWQQNIKTINEFVDKDNINSLLKENIKEKDIGLLSLDIDGNDYWVLQQLNEISPQIIVCEFNSLFGDIHQITVPYEKNFDRNKNHYSNLYFGASIHAFINLLKKKNFSFVGTCSTGVNAFFIKNELMHHIKEKIQNFSIFPSLAREGLDPEGNLDFKNTNDQLKKIYHLEVIDIKDNKKKKLSDFVEIYSKSWKNLFNNNGII